MRSGRPSALAASAVASRKAKCLLEQALFVDTLEFAQVPGLHAGRFRFLGRGAGGDVQRADGEVALEGVLQFADVPGQS